MHVEGDQLIIKVDLNQAGTPSSSGKTKLVASTRGSAKIQGNGRDLSVSLNVYVPINEKFTPKVRAVA